jgi:predicted 3-demethylubiquinone-9 3-methyltransferase (glyoxalase superfamily)
MHMKITSYLVFNGQAEEAAKFYAEALGRFSPNVTASWSTSSACCGR